MEMVTDLFFALILITGFVVMFNWTVNSIYRLMNREPKRYAIMEKRVYNDGVVVERQLLDVKEIEEAEFLLKNFTGYKDRQGYVVYKKKRI